MKQDETTLGWQRREAKRMDLRKLRLDEPAIGTFSEEREEFERDYARLIQSPAFRRLQGKSQVFGAGSGDYYRTRLTHSLEVAEIAGHIAQQAAESAKYMAILADRPH